MTSLLFYLPLASHFLLEERFVELVAQEAGAVAGGFLVDDERGGDLYQHVAACLGEGFFFIFYFPVSFFKITPPIFRSIPCFDIGMPVCRDIFCFNWVRPIARFHEKVRPGIFVFIFKVNSPLKIHHIG